MEKVFNSFNNILTWLRPQKKNPWKDHNLEFDFDSRSKSAEYLDKLKNEDEIRLLSKQIQWEDFNYKHFMIECGSYSIEVGPIYDICNARLNINENPKDESIVTTVTMNDEIRKRIGHILGMKNFSLCLRNSEHVTNYILYSKWYSSQMSKDGDLLKRFNQELKNKKALNKVNQFPSSVTFNPLSNNKSLYSFIERENHFEATGLEYCWDHKADTYNILMIGPSGKHVIYFTFEF